MNTQLMTFQVGRDLYAIEVLRVQEVTGELPTMPVPLAPNFVRGLINLRGQITTALGLQELFQLDSQTERARSAVVCKLDGSLVSLLVDAIGDVIDANESQFEAAPEIVPKQIRKYIKGIYKTDEALLSVLDLDKMSKDLFQGESA